MFAEKKISLDMDHRPQMTDHILLKRGTLEVQWDPMLMSCRVCNLWAWRLSIVKYQGF